MDRVSIDYLIHLHMNSPGVTQKYDLKDGGSLCTFKLVFRSLMENDGQKANDLKITNRNSKKGILS